MCRQRTAVDPEDLAKQQLGVEPRGLGARLVQARCRLDKHATDPLVPIIHVNAPQS